MMSGCRDHSAIWSRTKMWRRNCSSLVWAAEIRSGKVAVDITGSRRGNHGTHGTHGNSTEEKTNRVGLRSGAVALYLFSVLISSVFSLWSVVSSPQYRTAVRAYR